MSMGRRNRDRQPEFWVRTDALPTSPGHPFYDRLNRLLDEAGFDRFVEDLCRPYYAEGVGRPGIPPGAYFRMLLVGYFEELGSQRGIAWKCADSLSVRSFLSYEPGEPTPDHSSLTRVRDRLPAAVHERVFTFVLGIAQARELLAGKTHAVDSTFLEANAAMKNIVRKDTQENWNQYLTRLARADGIENPTAEDLRRFDRGREGKKVPNDEWESPTDPEARIAKMKDGRTHLAYKAENVVDLESDLLTAARVCSADVGDADTIVDTLLTAQANQVAASSDTEVEEVASDKGYHKAETLAELEAWGVRTYIPEKRLRGRRRWTNKPASHRRAVYANRRRVRGRRGRRLQRLRSEYVERSFAHICETGGARRTWLRGLEKVNKRYVIAAAGRNLGVIMRKLFGIGTPRSLQGGVLPSLCALMWQLMAGMMRWCAHTTSANRFPAEPGRPTESTASAA